MTGTIQVNGHAVTTATRPRWPIVLMLSPFEDTQTGAHVDSAYHGANVSAYGHVCTFPAILLDAVVIPLFFRTMTLRRLAQVPLIRQHQFDPATEVLATEAPLWECE